MTKTGQNGNINSPKRSYTIHPNLGPPLPRPPPPSLLKKNPDPVWLTCHMANFRGGGRLVGRYSRHLSFSRLVIRRPPMLPCGRTVPGTDAFLQTALTNCVSGTAHGLDYASQMAIAGYSCVPSMKAAISVTMLDSQIMSRALFSGWGGEGCCATIFGGPPPAGVPPP